MIIISYSDYTAMLNDTHRVYLCGDLAQPQPAPHFHTTGLEIGISRYLQFTAEKPHIHLQNNEYNYVLKGEIKVYLFHEQKEYLLRAGDMFIIEPDMPYITKALPDTDVLFVKDPGGNDKELCPETPAIIAWSASWAANMGS